MEYIHDSFSMTFFFFQIVVSQKFGELGDFGAFWAMESGQSGSHLVPGGGTEP